MKMAIKLLFVVGAGLPMVAQASWWDDIDISMDGFLRAELAARTTSAAYPPTLRENAMIALGHGSMVSPRDGSP